MSAALRITAAKGAESTLLSAESRNAPVLVCGDCGREVTATAVVTGAGTYCEPCMTDQRRKWWSRLGRPPNQFNPASWPLELGDCGWCGRPLRGGIKTHGKTLCCHGCEHEADKARRRVTHEPRACEWCGETFTPKRSDAVFCSTRCRVAAYRQRRREETPTP